VRSLDIRLIVSLDSPPAIQIKHITNDELLQVPLYSTQAIECISENPNISIDVTWRRVDAVCH
jgi:hypothetical protein